VPDVFGLATGTCTGRSRSSWRSWPEAACRRPSRRD